MVALPGCLLNWGSGRMWVLLDLRWSPLSSYVGYALLSYSCKSLEPAIVFSSLAICSQSIFVSIPLAIFWLSFPCPFIKINFVLWTSNVACWVLPLLADPVVSSVVLLFLIDLFLLALLTTLLDCSELWPRINFLFVIDFYLTTISFSWLVYLSRSTLDGCWSRSTILYLS